MLAIYKRELRSYFCSMIAYVYCAAMVLFIGLFFLVTNVAQGIPMFAYTMMSMTTILLFTTPILTMRSFAEERKAKTDQMLLTYPVSTIRMVMGKFLAMMTVVAIPFVISCLCPIIISAYGTGYPAIDYSTIFAMVCLTGLFVAIGMFISSLTENQVIAAVLTFGVLLILCLWDDAVQLIPASGSASLLGFIILLAVVVLLLQIFIKSKVVSAIVGGVGLIALLVIYFVKTSLMQNLLPTVLGYFSCTKPIYSFAYNSVFDMGGIFLYLSLAALFIFLTVQSIQKRRWSN